MSGDDRAERLRERRSRSKQKAENTDQVAGDSEGESASGDDANETGTESVKEEREGTYMYLPESQTRDLSRQYDLLKAEYEYEFDEDFEKNRHFYPLVIQYGLDGLEGLDAQTIQEHLDSLDV